MGTRGKPGERYEEREGKKGGVFFFFYPRECSIIRSSDRLARGIPKDLSSILRSVLRSTDGAVVFVR